ncbi:MAG: LLM class flavin-dependent oxidoreductase [Gammaproteobacteria bacterium]|jgi:alkanesulfonate monooxygenase SsuD/methylene tetrahydromethanopterin reductase-like flavin-dependent oxidoreductase (luciferase family)|nr:LLM class flavin-dependent oxidoreductase [Gammaproteobacteria bacterium]MDP6617730.1 LLM class flavin-dependent oxidoreductase [Gammaproteobacteria bacterium]MDP6694116.1 LLM class flavin-dependent oxidoreductase [Gammaproteobacteria bacterium]
MQIDLILDARARPSELAELGGLAEELGFGGIWVSSLLDGRDPFANMVRLADATAAIALGPVAVNPWDMHPVKISGALHTLNEISGGRARIVIGAGGEALASLGLKPRRRVRAVQECVEIIRIASGGKRFDFAGALYQVNGYGLGWLESPAPKVYVGANMDQMLRMSGRVAEGVMLSDLPIRLTSGAIQTARAAAAANDRNPDNLWFSTFTAWHVYDDIEQARREAKRWLLLRGLFRPWVLQEFLEPDEVELVMASQPAFLQAFVQGSHEIEGVPDGLADKLVDNLTLTASTDRLDGLVEELLAYRDAGLSSVSLRLYADPADSIRLLAEKVLPAVSA